jgi:isohexenylglutaconyl-CoA hydratase
MNLRFEWRGAFAHATLDRPAARHALTDEMVRGLRKACAAVHARADARALVIRGSEGTFCAGGDFARFKQLMSTPLPPGGHDPIAAANRAFGALLEAIVALDVPTLAVVEGAAMGGGVGLAAACDVVFAAANARFATPEVTLGLPPAQIAPFVARRMGAANAKRLLFTGETIDAATAARLGLVDEVASDANALDAMVEARLARLGRAEPASLRELKRLLDAERRGEPLVATLDAAALAFARCLRGGAPQEGLAAFADKRPAAWAVPPLPPAEGWGEGRQGRHVR